MMLLVAGTVPGETVGSPNLYVKQPDDCMSSFPPFFRCIMAMRVISLFFMCDSNIAVYGSEMPVSNDLHHERLGVHPTKSASPGSCPVSVAFFCVPVLILNILI